MNDLRATHAHAEEAVAPLVLLVDDSADLQLLFALRLRRAGYRVALASSGEAGVALARELHPSAVVMDLCMDGMDGWTATSELRADPETSGTPIIVVSGHTRPEHQERAYAAGCDVFIPKPCLPDALLSIVRGLLAQRGATSGERAPISRRA